MSHWHGSVCVAEYMAAPERFAEMPDSSCNAGAVQHLRHGGNRDSLLFTVAAERLLKDYLDRRIDWDFGDRVSTARRGR
jgi:hypothetical protein